MRVLAKCLGPALIATTILIAARSSLAPSQDVDIVPRPSLPGLGDLPGDWQIATRLAPHAGVVPRMVLSETCEAEGERELVALSAMAATEEAYLFVPELCAWLDVGHSERPDAVRIDVEAVDWAALRFPEIVLYHIHPGPPEAAAGYVPAYSDLLAAMLLDTPRAPGRTGLLRHRAVSAAGVIDYAFRPSEETRALIAHMIETGLSGHLRENLALIYSAPERVDAYLDAIRACARHAPAIADRPAQCFPLTVGEFTLTYREVAAGR